MPAINPNVFPVRRVPVLPRQLGDTMRQGDPRKCRVIENWFRRGLGEFSAEKPAAIQWHRAAGGAVLAGVFFAGDVPASQDWNGGNGGRAEGGVPNKFAAREKPASILLRDDIFHFSTGMEMQGVEIRSAKFERRMNWKLFQCRAFGKKSLKVQNILATFP